MPLLVWHFVELLQGSVGRQISEIPVASMHRLQEYDWPGNVRELRNFVERALILSTGPVLEVDPRTLRPRAAPPSRKAPPAGPAEPETLEHVEREHIRRVLERADGRIKGAGGAAERLGLPPSTLYYRLRKLGIEPPRRRAVPRRPLSRG